MEVKRKESKVKEGMKRNEKEVKKRSKRKEVKKGSLKKWQKSHMLAVTDFFKSCLKKEWLINEKHGQGTHSTEMGVDKSVENTLCPYIYLL